jgi:integrase
MAKLIHGQLSKHPSKGYRLTSGWYMKDSKKRPKVFWLGQDENKAHLTANTVRWYQPVVTAAGEGWTAFWVTQLKASNPLEIIRRRFAEAEQTRQMLAPHLAPDVVVQSPTTSGNALNDIAPAKPDTAAASDRLHGAWDAFAEAVRSQPLSYKHQDSIQHSIVALKRYQADVPLKQVDYAFLEQLTALIKSRPLSRKKCRATGKKQPIKPYTVKRLLQHLRQATAWLHRQRESNRFGGWRAPSDWQELFNLQLTRIMTKAERDRAADGPEQIQLEEIVNLYRTGIGNNRQAGMHRAWFLTALFAGLGQMELATIRRDEFNLDGATLTHRRNKTGVQGVYWLPPELVKMLGKLFKGRRTEEGGLAFRTRKGQPIVTRESDAVRQAFDDWRQRCASERKAVGPRVTFYGLRRFFGDYATRIGGESVGDAALAHTAKSVRGKHYSGFRDFEKVREAGQRLHAELKFAGMFKPLDQKEKLP